MPINICFPSQYEYLASSRQFSCFTCDPSVENCHKFAMPTIRVMQPIWIGAGEKKKKKMEEQHQKKQQILGRNKEFHGEKKKSQNTNNS